MFEDKDIFFLFLPGLKASLFDIVDLEVGFMFSIFIGPGVVVPFIAVVEASIRIEIGHDILILNLCL